MLSSLHIFQWVNLIMPHNSLGFVNEEVEPKSLGVLPGITQLVVVKQWPSLSPHRDVGCRMSLSHAPHPPGLCSFPSVSLCSGRRLLGPGCRKVTWGWERRAGGIWGWEKNGLKLYVQTGLCGLRITARAGKNSDRLLHWISNQAEYLCHTGSLKKKYWFPLFTLDLNHNGSRWHFGGCSF